MTRTVFIWGHSDDHGTDGWIPKDQPDFDPNEHFGVAHDTLDHANLAEGSIEEEARAFGAMMYSRGMGHWWKDYRNDQFRRPADWHMGVSFGDIYGRHFADGREGPMRMPEGAAGTRRLEDEAELMLEATVASALKTADQEMGYEDHDDGEAESDKTKYLAALREALPRWMRIGYRNCRRRFQAEPWQMAGLFSELVEELKRIAPGEHEEGDQLIIRIQPRSLRLDVRVKSRYDHGN